MTAARLAPRAHARAELGRRLSEHCRDRLALPEATVTVTPRPRGAAGHHATEIARDGHHIRIACDDKVLQERPNELLHRLIGVLTILARMPLERFRLVADLSDGEESKAGMVAFCSRDPGAILIPDHGFVRTLGQDSHRRVARANALAWSARSDRILWRGQTTGSGAISKPQLSADDPELLPRVRLCLALKGIPDTDARLSVVSQSRDREVDIARLGEAGILGTYVSPIVWNGLKFAIDIDGNTNAWSNLLTRLIMGCCVLKVASPLGYRQWYYDDLAPWTHYVPVKTDLSDLVEQIAWCRANPDACGRIAASGQAFAMARDFETEVAAAARRVCEAHAGGMLRAKVG
ncbi:MAG: glycosyl transferase family 90 [Xanthobacteraceae bacterium]|nr:glycosyl transferase family 90 [Xanthobacteraceae bacterium]